MRRSGPDARGGRKNACSGRIAVSGNSSPTRRQSRPAHGPAVFTIRRVRRSIDRALELDPDYVDALVAKARLLRRLPRQWGGDRVEARRCLATALRLDPTHGEARMYAVSEGMPVTSGEPALPLGTDSR